MLELPDSAVNRFSLKPFGAAASWSLQPIARAKFRPILRNSSRRAEKNLQGRRGHADIRFTHDSGCCRLSKVQTSLRTCVRAYCQAFIKKL
jgi:hypothetical protein